MRELPFMASENIMMDAVKKGGDRQALHEKLRQYAMQAGKRVKEEGLDNNLIELVLADPDFKITREEIDAILMPESFTGRSEQQVEEFVTNCVQPVLDKYKDELSDAAVELSV